MWKVKLKVVTLHLKTRYYADIWVRFCRNIDIRNLGYWEQVMYFNSQSDIEVYI